MKFSNALNFDFLSTILFLSISLYLGIIKSRRIFRFIVSFKIIHLHIGKLELKLKCFNSNKMTYQNIPLLQIY